ncbi:MAG TPA: glycosyltransferase family 2 protein [Pseudonocardiaceae bacterium]|jgi:glycosyltransferase involved in cell wall biosynthesis|nr:glycosyltransferase family 2 protein [Pseudonocardiaceae bacterium]
MARTVSPTLSIVIPARNEARNLEVVLPELPAEHEIILVDGGSVDGTVETTLRLRPDAHILQQTRKGKGNALACGFLAATGDIVVMFDADGSANPQEIPAFVNALLAGADFAKGTRFHREQPEAAGSEDITRLRTAGNSVLNGLSNVLFSTSFSDLCYGYNAFWRDVVPVLDLPSPELPAGQGEMIWCDGFEIETVISCRVVAAGLKIAEVPSIERSRLYGQSNLRTFYDGYRVLRTIMSERRRAQQMRREEVARARQARPRAEVPQARPHASGEARTRPTSPAGESRNRPSSAMLPEKSL